MTTANLLIGSLLSIYNNPSYLQDPISGRVGSFFFGPNQDIIDRVATPKGKITAGTDESDTWSFGRTKVRDKHYTIIVSFLTQHNVVSGSGLKNEQLVYDYLEKIENTTLAYRHLLGNVVIERSEVLEDPFKLDDNNTYIGRRVFVFKERK